MKKNYLLFYIVLMTATLFSNRIQAANGNTTIVHRSMISSKDSIEMFVRLYEIKSMDISTLNSAEKSQLKKEVKSIEKKMKLSGGGLYISAGALIIIILLLILFI